MATTITAATLTVNLTEAITLNGQDKGATNTLTIASVTEVTQGIANVITTEGVVIAFGTAIGAGQFVESTTKYVRLTNKDDTNFVQLTFRDENSTEFAVKLDAGHSFIYAGDNAGGVVDTMIAAGSALTVPSTFADLVDVTAVADTADCDLEYFVAGT